MNTDVMLLTPVRSVLVYSTVGQTKKEIQTNAANWSQLKAALLDHGVGTQGMKAVIGESQVSLDLDEAKIPTEGFTLFLVPSKVESGYYDSDGDWIDEDDDNEPVSDYTREDAIEDLKEARELTAKALRFLGDPGAKVSVRPSDPQTAALDDQAQAIMSKMKG